MTRSSRFAPRRLALIAAVAAAAALAGSGEAATIFTVTTTADSGAGSLRAAITAANGHSGLDTVAFNIAGGGPVTIDLQSPLPFVADPVVLDGTTQPGYARRPLVELNGAAVPGLTVWEGLLVVESGGSTIRGLVVNRSSVSGLILRHEGENVVEGNFLGTDHTGEIDLGNGVAGILVDDSSANTIRSNLSSGNAEGIYILRGHSNVIVGNRLGTNADGTAPVPNGSGVLLVGPANTVGGTSPGAGNLISGNTHRGVGIQTMSLAGIVAAGNIVQGNLIGTDLTGTSAIPNGTLGGDGVVIERGAFGNKIGGPEPGARNVISGNRLGSGVAISYESNNNVVQGNFIGVDRRGSRAIPNMFGIYVAAGSTGNTIGGTARGEGNVISGNLEQAVELQLAPGNRVEGNTIGTSAGPVLLPIGNGGSGVEVISDGDDANLIRANMIANNAQGGVVVWGGGTGTSILSNLFSANTGPAIDLINDPSTVGPTPNDPGDFDGGTNGMQNYPVLTWAAPSGKGTEIRGGLRSTFGGTFRVEFFASPACDASGFGEAAIYLGSRSVSTDLFGKADFSFWTPTQVPAGQVITATATSFSGSTSELSGCKEVAGKVIS